MEWDVQVLTGYFYPRNILLCRSLKGKGAGSESCTRPLMGFESACGRSANALKWRLALVWDGIADVDKACPACPVLGLSALVAFCGLKIAINDFFDKPVGRAWFALAELFETIASRLIELGAQGRRAHLNAWVAMINQEDERWPIGLRSTSVWLNSLPLNNKGSPDILQSA